MKNQGTPKNLREAIENALLDPATLQGCDVTKAIEEHVLDYFRQKFGAAFLQMDDCHDMYGMKVLEDLAKETGVKPNEKPKT